ncbi:MAG: acyl transferase [Chitinophagales bacterium]
MKRDALRRKIFQVDASSFEKIALEIFQFQFAANSIYQRFCSLLGRHPENVFSIEEIPFLPVEFFKDQQVMTGSFAPEKIFESSGTTAANVSKHFLRDLALYEESFLKCFELFFGKPEDYVILALLPSYLERSDSSLVYMVKGIMKRSHRPENGFFHYNHSSLYEKLKALESKLQKTLLIGVSFALLDFAEKFSIPLHHTTLIETGGMKGRREELTREELHSILKKSFSLDKISGEYGMTELLSQAYSFGDGKFQTPPWMKILLRDINDPAAVSADAADASGVINIIDLANLDSCSFLATADVGKLNEDSTFEVLGRTDFSDVRGCNLMLG